WIETEKSETKKELGGSETTVTTYSYAKGWSDEAKNSSEFNNPAGHENPSMEIFSRKVQVPEAKLQAFTLDTPVLNDIGGAKALPIEQGKLAEIDAAYPGTKRVSVTNGGIYLGFNPTSPAVGDYRISYEIVPLQTVSIIGRQSGSMFAEYQTQAGDALLMVDEGNVAADKMFADAQSANMWLTWILRLAGILLMAVGFGLIFAPLGIVGDLVPFIGSIVRFGTGLLAFLLAIVIGTVTIAIAWFWYRPILSLIIIAAGLAIAAVVYMIGRRRSAAAPAAPLPQAAPAAPAAPAPAAPAPGKSIW
ncbi:MAG: TMEM43 family protein, partial [Rhizobiaceae bacterium]